MLRTSPIARVAVGRALREWARTVSDTTPQTRIPVVHDATDAEASQALVDWLRQWGDRVPALDPIDIHSSKAHALQGEGPVGKLRRFNVGAFLALLRTHRAARVLAYARCTTSTQRLLSEGAVGVSDWVCFITDVQTVGAGRGGNSWVSPPGCLMFSFKCPGGRPALLPLFQYIVSLALVEAVGSVPGCESLPLGIKWPNDIYARGNVKVGGVLCQSCFANGQFEVVVGIGLNVLNEQPTLCLNGLAREAAAAAAGTSLADVPAALVTREQVMAAFFNVFEPMLQEFLARGFAPLKERYLARWLHTGQRVRVTAGAQRTDTGARVGGEEVEVTVQGLTDGGYLQAVDEGGAVLELMPDGNSFDFMAGLIARKRGT